MAGTKRDAICEAALELFAEQGIEATTTREIAERAGAAEGTLYRHFQGKDDLVEWLFEHSAEQFYDVLTEAAEGITEPRARLRALIRGVFDFSESHPAAFKYLLSAHHTGVLRRRDAKQPPPMRLFVETLKAGVDRGVFREIPYALATGWIVAMAQRAVIFLESAFLSASREETIRQTVAGALRIVDARQGFDAKEGGE